MEPIHGSNSRGIHAGQSPKGVIYIGVTSNLLQRLYQHQNNLTGGFTAKYGVRKLMWYEVHNTMESAILREKQLKAGSRARKVGLIEAGNPEWCDLSAQIR